jgi:hypothetical protein
MDKLLGGKKQILHTGSTEWTAPDGFAAYGIGIRVDATEIATLDELRSGRDKAATANTGYSWMGVATLLAGESIIFEHPVTAITLTNATDSIWIYCEYLN